MPRHVDFKQSLCADIQGFSLHAAVRCGADERQALEQLCPYITRPALANERVQANAAEQVVFKRKTPWRDGTTHRVMSPLEFMQRLAARATEGRPTGALATPQAAPDSLPWRSRTQRQAARAGGAARARAARTCRTARRVRGDVRASPPNAAELGQAAQAGLRNRHGALPELRRRAEDHHDDSRATGHREDPHAPGSAGQGTATRASPWVAAASGLRSPAITFHAARAQGSGDQLRQSFLRAKVWRPIARESQETVATDDALLGCGRPSTGSCRTQAPHQWVVKSLAGGPWEKKVRWSFPSSTSRR